MKLRHWIIFILLNIVVSAATILALLTYWERTRPPRTVGDVAQVSTPEPITAQTPMPAASPVPPRPTPTLTPFPHTVYVVQSGDTLSALSRRFDVSLADLLAANGLSIDAVLHVGQELLIPTDDSASSGLSPSPGPVASLTPSPSPTPASSELAPLADVAAEIRQVIARGDPTRETVVIANLGQPVNLLGWKVVNNAGIAYTFPDLTMWPGGTITLHTGSGPDSVSDLYWKRSAPVWAEPGDVVSLMDADGKLVARYQLP
ncbi:MAG: lamin tail domain-containing protein [Thermoflexales bacterium]|nr:lamin tail domain-containing protein [Thermoflexales bacterium]